MKEHCLDFLFARGTLRPLSGEERKIKPNTKVLGSVMTKLPQTPHPSTRVHHIFLSPSEREKGSFQLQPKICARVANLRLFLDRSMSNNNNNKSFPRSGARKRQERAIVHRIPIDSAQGFFILLWSTPVIQTSQYSSAWE